MNQQVGLALGCVSGLIDCAAARHLSNPFTAYHTAQSWVDTKWGIQWCKDKIWGTDVVANDILTNEYLYLWNESILSLRNIAPAIRDFPYEIFAASAVGGAIIGAAYPQYATLGLTVGTGCLIFDAGRKAYRAMIPNHAVIR